MPTPELSLRERFAIQRVAFSPTTDLLAVSGMRTRRSLSKTGVVHIWHTSRKTHTRTFSFGDGCDLSDWDIECFDRASRLLSSPDSIRLCPSEIGPEQARVLLGAASKHVEHRHMVSVVQLTQVGARDVAGGRSGARIVRLTPDDGGVPLIAKMDTIDRLEQEMMRFHQHIHPWNPALSPQIHFHAGAGLILFSLVEDPGQPGQPAPTLEDQIDHVMFGELWEHGPPLSVPTDLPVLITRAIQKLGQLNERPCGSTPLSSCAWLGLDGIDVTLRRGITWEFRLRDGSLIDVFALRAAASTHAGELAGSATVHGDVQLRNVLARDRTPHFIDYALSGPGHPCFDLVRLEASLLFRCFRPTLDECSMAELFNEILGGATVDDAKRSAPLLMTSIGNQLAVHTAVQCGKELLRLAKRFGGGIEDVLAVRYIVACQSLFYPALQTSVVRAYLVALATQMRRHAIWQTDGSG